MKYEPLHQKKKQQSAYAQSSRKHVRVMYEYTPLNRTFYIAKLGYAGVYLFFLTFAPKHRLWVFM